MLGYSFSMHLWSIRKLAATTLNE